MREGFNGLRKDCGSIAKSRGRLGRLPDVAALNDGLRETCGLRFLSGMMPSSCYAFKHFYLEI